MRMVLKIDIQLYPKDSLCQAFFNAFLCFFNARADHPLLQPSLPSGKTREKFSVNGAHLD
jgi:hypothetical protein